jgi:hypothetical protein
VHLKSSFSSVASVLGEIGFHRRARGKNFWFQEALKVGISIIGVVTRGEKK